MVAGLRQLAPISLAVFCLALALPPLALASGGGKCSASACKVYVEPNGAPSGGKQSTTPPTRTGSSGGGHTRQPKGMARVLLHAGKDRGPLSRLMHDSGIAPLQGSGDVAGPGLLGAALDLGVGPLALLGILLATALGFGAHGVMRNRRRPTA